MKYEDSNLYTSRRLLWIYSAGFLIINYGKKDTIMRFITSLNPNNILKNQQCIESWKKYTNDIVAVQGPGESDKLAEHFPGVTFVTSTEVGDWFEAKFCPRMHVLVNQGPGIIINSDIQVVGSYDEFACRFYTDREKTLECGIRWDYKDQFSNAIINPYGIDAFKITEDLIPVLNKDYPFAIGQPGWDYNFILMARDAGYVINAHKNPPIFMHEVHEVNWAQWKLTLAQSLLEKIYLVGSRQITGEVQRLTGRPVGHRARRLRA